MKKILLPSFTLDGNNDFGKLQENEEFQKINKKILEENIKNFDLENLKRFEELKELGFLKDLGV